MATLARQPFAPLDGARLHNLTSLKNRQNALSSPTSAKRKASDSVEIDNFENVDPLLYSKRTKATDSFFSSAGSLAKPGAFFVLTKAHSTPSLATRDATLSAAAGLGSPVKAAAPRPRDLLQPKSPAAKLNTNVARSPLSAPAGRSPTRRTGILSNNRRRTGGFSRVDPPPAFNLDSAAPFSLDAALKGTIPSYVSRSSLLPPSSSAGLDGAAAKASWFFDIHEDTAEQEMTNLLQHSTCVLDISSDEESEQKARRERAEGRDKENIPPADDVSQTSRSRASAARAASSADEMMVEKMRGPLSQLNAADFYAAGCDESSVIIVPGDEDDNDEAAAAEAPPSAQLDAIGNIAALDFAPTPDLDGVATVEELMKQRDAPTAKAAVLEPIDGTGETFELWESGSAKDDNAMSSPPAPVDDGAC